jgi:hypothetical protein
MIHPIHFHPFAKKGIDMSILDTIFEKLGLQKPSGVKADLSSTTGPAGGTAADYVERAKAQAASGSVSGIKKEMPMVDVMSKLEQMAKKATPGLNWKQSINDLMMLLGMDHSAAAIKELAVELNCPEAEMNDSFRRNSWTYTALLRKIAENGGNIPPELLK